MSEDVVDEVEIPEVRLSVQQSCALYDAVEHRLFSAISLTIVLGLVTLLSWPPPGQELPWVCYLVFVLGLVQVWGHLWIFNARVMRGVYGTRAEDVQDLITYVYVENATRVALAPYVARYLPWVLMAAFIIFVAYLVASSPAYHLLPQVFAVRQLAAVFFGLLCAFNLAWNEPISVDPLKQHRHLVEMFVVSLVLSGVAYSGASLVEWILW